MSWIYFSTERQRTTIKEKLLPFLERLAQSSAHNWHNLSDLDQSLRHFLLREHSNFKSRLLYAINLEGFQHSSNISNHSIESGSLKQNLSERPYQEKLNKIINAGDDSSVIMTDVYIDQRSRKPCITLLHKVSLNDTNLGYIAADFRLKDLPLDKSLFRQKPSWVQIKGDPSIRNTIFEQSRTTSEMDKNIDQVLHVIESLITEQGIFHAKLHFSSSRVTLWPYQDPYHYRLHVLDEIINPDVCLSYPTMNYPEIAIISPEKVYKTLQMFKMLRESDETIYLRAASINIMNGIVGLNFSCDGSHYLPVDEFLNKYIPIWLNQKSN
ncbi:MAG: hypothetical protein ACWA5R_07290 [bacterium]